MKLAKETLKKGMERRERREKRGGEQRRGEEEEEKDPEKEMILDLDLPHNILFSRVSKHSPLHHGFAKAILLQIKTGKVSVILDT